MRHLQHRRYSLWFDEEHQVVTFPLWNLSGQMVGYQQYRPGAPKDTRNHPRDGRYFTFTKKPHEAMWGLESWNYRSDVLFIVEGIFDAVRLHNLNLPAVATLCSDPKLMKPFFRSCGRKILAVCDPSGSKLSKIADSSYTMTLSDLGDASDYEVFAVANNLLNQ